MTTTLWVTKHALTHGVVRAEDCTVRHGYARRAKNPAEPLRVGVEAFEDESEARANVVVRIRRRLAVIREERKRLLEMLRALEAER